MKITIEDPIIKKENNLFLVELIGLNRERFKTDRSWDAIDAKRYMRDFPYHLYSFSESKPRFNLKKIKKISNVSENDLTPFSLLGINFRGKSPEEIVSQLQDTAKRYIEAVKKINLTIKQINSIAKSKTQGVLTEPSPNRNSIQSEGVTPRGY